MLARPCPRSNASSNSSSCRCLTSRRISRFSGSILSPLSRSHRLGAFCARVEQLAADQPLGLLGFHYVLEGSNNGSKYIAMGMGKAYGLEPGPGLRYLDPYGEAQRERWDAFRSSMESVGFSPAEKDLLVACAKEMFEALIRIGDEFVGATAG